MSMKTPPEREPRAGGRAGRLIAGAATGNFVERFDFTLYGFAATIIATTFFPTKAGFSGIAATFVIYAGAFIVRPFGGLVLGRIGDRYGRRRALALSVIMMGVATAGIALVPTFAQIGWVAPAILLVLRLLQGFSAAGEFIGATTFVMEHAPERRRGLWCSFITTSTWAAGRGSSSAGRSMWRPAGTATTGRSGSRPSCSRPMRSPACGRSRCCPTVPTSCERTSARDSAGVPSSSRCA